MRLVQMPLILLFLFGSFLFSTVLLAGGSIATVIDADLGRWAPPGATPLQINPKSLKEIPEKQIRSAEKVIAVDMEAREFNGPLLVIKLSTLGDRQAVRRTHRILFTLEKDAEIFLHFLYTGEKDSVLIYDRYDMENSYGFRQVKARGVLLGVEDRGLVSLLSFVNFLRTHQEDEWEILFTGN